MNYRFQSKYPSCQLIEIINAGIYLGLGDVSDERFLDMEKEGGCIDGGCADILQFFNELGIERIQPEFENINSLQWIKDNLPVGILTSVTSLHRSLIVDVDDYKVTIINHDLGNGKYGNANISFDELLDIAIKPYVNKNGKRTKKRMPRLQEFSYIIKTR
jgi:hypothetical protein